MKRIIPFSPHYTIDEYGRVFGPADHQLDYEVRQNQFGDVLTVALGEGDQMQWHSVIDLLSAVHFDGEPIVWSNGSKLGFTTLFHHRAGFVQPQVYGVEQGRWLNIAKYWANSRPIPSQKLCTEVWYRYQNQGQSLSEINAAIHKIDGYSSVGFALDSYRSVVRAALLAGVRE